MTRGYRQSLFPLTHMVILLLVILFGCGCDPPPQLDVSTFGMRRNFQDNRAAFDEVVRLASKEKGRFYLRVDAIREGKPPNLGSYSDRDASFVAQMAKMKAWDLQKVCARGDEQEWKGYLRLTVYATGLSVSGSEKAYCYYPPDSPFAPERDIVGDLDKARQGRQGEGSGLVYVELEDGWYAAYTWN